MFKRKSALQKILKNTPVGHMYVSDHLIAVPMGGDKCITIVGDFKNITAEEANIKLQNALAKFSE